MKFDYAANQNMGRFSEDVNAGIPDLQENESRARLKRRFFAGTTDSRGEEENKNHICSGGGPDQAKNWVPQEEQEDILKF